jgi:pyruvate,water dikinase
MYIINLDSVDGQTPGVGSKANSLGALAKAGFLIPKGFVVASGAFEKFLSDTGISLLLPRILEGVSLEEPGTAFQASRQIRELFYKISGNDFIIRELRDAYNELSFGKDVSVAGGMALDLIKAGRTEHFVSIRPSIICSQEGVSFSGHGKAVLNQISWRQILAGVKECWLSVFSPEAILYRTFHGISQFSLAVIVQKMVDSELSGTLFTQEPVSGDTSRMLVEGFWGLGETLCCGCLSPDQYLIEKDGSLASKRVGKKMWLRRRGPLSGQTIQEKVPLSKISMETLSERDFPRFAAIAEKAEEIFKAPQEIEWCVERGRIVLLQSRPIFQASARKEVETHPSSEVPPSELLVSNAQGASAPEPVYRGLGVSPGEASGKALIFPLIQKSENPGILVTKNLGVDILPYMKWFSGIVAEQGGAGSCMASVGRELGIPIVAGVENACILLEGKEIAIDGGKGEVYFASCQAPSQVPKV